MIDVKNWVAKIRQTFAPLLSERVRNVAKVVWMVLVTIFVVRYMVRNWSSIADTFSSFSAGVLIATVIVTVAGKVFISIHSQLITKLNGRQFTFRESFWMYSASDLVKYIPGGLWNALARVRLYTNMGMTTTSSAKAFALEKYWMVLGALATGAIFLSGDIAQWLGWSSSAPVVIAVCVFFAGIWTLATWVGGRLTGNPVVPLAVLRSMGEQVIIAVFLGLGVWIPLAAVDSGISVFVAIGAFSVGRGLGYVAVFAPAGIGVREVVTLWALGGSSTSSQTVVVALAVNRVMTFIADVASFGLSLSVKPRSNSTN